MTRSIEDVLRIADDAGRRICAAPGGEATAGSAGAPEFHLGKPAGPHEKGGMTTFTVHDDDGRRAADATSYPYRAVFRVISHFDAPEQGTAFLVSNQTMLTAGHCIVQAETGQRVPRLEVYDGSGRGYAVEKTTFLKEWHTTRADSTDIGFIKLRDPIGLRRGFFGTRSFPDKEISGKFAVSGYPDDLQTGVQYFSLGNIVKSDPSFFFYDVDTEEGQSGAPLFYTSNGVATAIGIHIQGATGDRESNMALRLTPALVRLVRQWGA